jgi:hypothetical protein
MNMTGSPGIARDTDGIIILMAESIRLTLGLSLLSKLPGIPAIVMNCKENNHDC